MLEPTEATEPVNGSAEPNNTPSDTLPPRRRRRAASRPAGPPAGAADTSAETVQPTVPAAESDAVADVVDETQDQDQNLVPGEDPDLENETADAASVDAAAAGEAKPDEEPAPARPRRRAV
uniref:hypothetical protein n=1 Tax=Streptomyces sp. CRN 30 TaxID=3075613 RepID=UPI002A820FCB